MKHKMSFVLTRVPWYVVIYKKIQKWEEINLNLVPSIVDKVICDN